MENLQQKTKASDRIYKFTVEQYEDRNDTPIWRTLEIPESYSFYDLHVAIQDSLIWSDIELHKFEMENPLTQERDYIGIPDDLMCEPIISEKDALIANYFSLANCECMYMYNFVEPYTFCIRLEKILPAIPHIKYPRCVDGDGMVPEMLSDDDEDTCSQTESEFDLKNIEFRDPEMAWLDAFQGF